MWKLVYRKNSNETFRDGFATQWDALRAAFKEDGTRFKKAEAMNAASGTFVYREQMHRQSVRQFTDEGKVYFRQVVTPSRLELILQEC